MTRQPLLKASIPIALLMLVTAAHAAQSDKQGKDGSAPLQLPITGSVATGGAFTGTLSILRFEARGSEVVAIGMVTGSVAGVGTALVGSVDPRCKQDGFGQGPHVPQPFPLVRLDLFCTYAEHRATGF